MKKTLALCSLIVLLTAASYSNDKKSDNQDPIAFGIITQNTGCVIFKEYRKTTGMFWGVAVTTKTYSVLEVVETQHSQLEQKQWPETQENMNELMRLATKDKLKYVKIPKNYSSEQLEKARTMCMATPAP